MASRQSTGLVCPSAMETHCSGAVRAFLVPPTGLMMPLAWERKNKHGGVCVERHQATQFQGHGKARAAVTPSIFHHLAARWAPPSEPGMSEQRSLWKPQESPQKQPLPTASAPAIQTRKQGLPSGLRFPGETLMPGQHRPKEPGDPAHWSSGHFGTNCTFSSLKLCWDKCFRVPISSTLVFWRLSACGW